MERYLFRPQAKRCPKDVVNRRSRIGITVQRVHTQHFADAIEHYNLFVERIARLPGADGGVEQQTSWQDGTAAPNSNSV